MRERKGFVGILKKVFETLSVKFVSRFPRGRTTFAKGPSRVYSSPDLNAKHLWVY